jgi:hypothetical protein
LVSVKTFAAIGLVLGILVVIIPLLWCYIIPTMDVNLMVWTEVALGAIIAIVAALALATKS